MAGTIQKLSAFAHDYWIAMRKGSHHTESSKQKMRFSQLKRYATGEPQKKISASHIEGYRTGRIVNGMTGKHHGKEARRKQRMAKLGKKHGPRSEEHKKRLRLSWKDPDKRAEQSRIGYARWKDPDKRAKQSRIAHELWKDPDKRAKQSRIARKRWKNREYRENQLLKIIAGNRKRPTSFEQMIIDVIQENEYPFRYIGDGKQIVGYVNPDFIDTLGLDPPLLMEPHNLFHHPKNYEEVRHKNLCVPKENVLYFSGKDFDRKDWKEHCSRRIKEFLEFHQHLKTLV